MATNSLEYNRAYRERPGVREKLRENQRRWRERVKHTEKYKDAARRQGRKTAGMVDPTGEKRRGPCEICGLDKPLHCDHDHSTGKIRGWLCIGCNTALGKVERAGWLEAMYRYKKGNQP